jgi:dienelactone hydrolase
MNATLSSNLTDLILDIDDVRLEADLSIPPNASGLVVFAHGSGSSRHHYRHGDVAAHLQSAGFATLLFNLLSRWEDAQEAIEPRLRFDVPLLSRRLIAVTRWAHAQPELRDLRLGYFGASTGATAALIAAAELPEIVDAVVSRGGRPDLAGGTKARVLAPTLLLVGGWDDVVLEANREAFAALRCEKHLEIIPHATHRFEEPGALRRVAQLADDWFRTHLARPPLPQRQALVQPTLPAVR